MNRWLRFIALLAVAGMSIWLGFQPEDGPSQGWLVLALIAVFAASDHHYWGSGRHGA